MGQQRRRPEAGEGCFNQASQEDVLEEVTTGPPPATFASVRGRSRSKSSKARKRFPRPGNSATSAPRPGPRHPRAPFPFRGPRPPTRASAHISSLENLLPGSNSANRGGGTNHQSEFSFKIRTCGAVRSAGDARPADAVADAAGLLFPPVMGRRGAGRAQRDWRGRQGTSGATSPEPCGLFWAIKNKAG